MPIRDAAHWPVGAKSVQLHTHLHRCWGAKAWGVQLWLGVRPCPSVPQLCHWLALNQSHKVHHLPAQLLSPVPGRAASWLPSIPCLYHVKHADPSGMKQSKSSSPAVHQSSTHSQSQGEERYFEGATLPMPLCCQVTRECLAAANARDPVSDSSHRTALRESPGKPDSSKPGLQTFRRMYYPEPVASSEAGEGITAEQSYGAFQGCGQGAWVPSREPCHSTRSSWGTGAPAGGKDAPPPAESSWLARDGRGA